MPASASRLQPFGKIRPHAIAGGDAVDQIANLDRFLIVKTDAVASRLMW
jgi:hypothetical protein